LKTSRSEPLRTRVALLGPGPVPQTLLEELLDLGVRSIGVCPPQLRSHHLEPDLEELERLSGALLNDLGGERHMMILHDIHRRLKR
jgi:hypothetical protein